MFKIDALNILTIIACANAFLWLVGLLITVRSISKHKPLKAFDKELSNKPFVSILVPARNEEHRWLIQSMLSFLSQDYDNFEIVAVNDRSTDKTGEILREIAKSNKKLKVIEGKDLPDGWLGKPHALQQAFESSQGEWILATDADMIFNRRAIRTVINHALTNNYDAVTLLPHIECLSFWECVLVPTLGWYGVMAWSIEKVNNPKRKKALGVGGFFLIKREALKKIDEYKGVKAEVIEDLRTAENLKRSGAKLRMEYAPDLARTRMQTNLKELWEGFTKNLFAGTKFSLAKTFFGLSSILLFAVTPPLIAFVCALLILFGGYNELIKLFIPCALIYVFQALIYAVVNHKWKIPLWYALVTPLGHALFTAILINSTVKIISGQGVTWKGRKFYERGGIKPSSEF